MNQASHVHPHHRHPLTTDMEHIGIRTLADRCFSLVEYNESTMREQVVQDVVGLPTIITNPGVRWLNVDGVHDAATMKIIAERFQLSQLAMDEVVNASDRSKLEEFDECVFLVIKMLAWDDKSHKIVVERVSMVIGCGFVMTFQEHVGDVFDGVRDRLRQAKGRMRKSGADHLAHALLDAIVDHYHDVLDHLADRIDAVDVKVEAQSRKLLPQELHVLKREVLFLRREIWPARETLSALAGVEDQRLVGATTAVGLRDVRDHLAQAIDSTEMMRESVSSLLDIYHAGVANRMNEVMKLLTIMSTIFIPLNFIAGVYGMNFDNIPGLHGPNSFWHVIAVMMLVGGGMLAYVLKNRWL
jgi:magnesium transporter